MPRFYRIMSWSNEANRAGSSTLSTDRRRCSRKTHHVQIVIIVFVFFFSFSLYASARVHVMPHIPLQAARVEASKSERKTEGIGERGHEAQIYAPPDADCRHVQMCSVYLCLIQTFGTRRNMPISIQMQRSIIWSADFGFISILYISNFVLIIRFTFFFLFSGRLCVFPHRTRFCGFTLPMTLIHYWVLATRTHYTHTHPCTSRYTLHHPIDCRGL